MLGYLFDPEGTPARPLQPRLHPQGGRLVDPDRHRRQPGDGQGQTVDVDQMLAEAGIALGR